jgi:adhesin/invasin
MPAIIGPVSHVTLAGVAGAPLPDSVAVRALDENGNPVEGVSVAFTVVDGGGTVSPTSGTSNADGVVRSLWTLGPHAGPNSMEARGEGVAVPAVMLATGSAGPASKFTIISGSAQTDTVTQILPGRIVLRLTDANDNPISDAPIDWSWGWGVPSGTFAPDVSETNANGEWSATWTLGEHAGEFQVTAVARSSGMAVGFTAKAVADSPQYITVVEPGSLKEFSSYLEWIRTFDRYSNPSGGMLVNVAVTNGSTVSPASVVTDANGNGFVTWTMPAAPQSVMLEASSPAATEIARTIVAVIK